MDNTWKFTIQTLLLQSNRPIKKEMERTIQLGLEGVTGLIHNKEENEERLSLDS
jgi:hypothetical protein